MRQIAQGGQGGARATGAPGLELLIQRCSDAQRATKSTHHVDRAHMCMFLGRVHGPTETGHDAGGGLHQIVVAEVACARAGARAAEAVELAEDGIGVELLQALGVQAHGLHLTVGRVPHDHIAGLDQLFKNGAAFGLCDVGQHGSLAAHVRHAKDHRVPAVVKRLGRIQLDHLGAKTRQIGHRMRPGNDVAQVENAHAVEPAVAGVLLSHAGQFGLDGRQHFQRLLETH